MRYLLLSDIHGNVEALNAVLDCVERDSSIKGCILLGDLVDYGMHSNEVIHRITGMSIPIILSLIGNHEAAILKDDYTRFSSDRGRSSAKHTRGQLTDTSIEYLSCLAEGPVSVEIDGKRVLCVHGSLDDALWKSIVPGEMPAEYSDYDFVLSGHSHRPHFFEQYYKVDNPATRNEKKTVFINPGSVGQPRNLDPAAQFAILDFETGEMEFKRIPYDIEAEQSAFDGSVDDFYRSRLSRGI